MKKIYSFLVAVFFTVSVFAQAPQKMSYQGVIHNSNNNLVKNQLVGMKISIIQTTSSGTAVYVETQSPTTNENGLVSLEIGSGTIVSGAFSTINWENGPYFIKTETDLAGGTNYTITGTSEFLSVPYALYSLNSTPGPQGETGLAGINGNDGISAYQTAVNEGFIGSEAQWLTSLHGSKGDTGLKGDTGAAGMSKVIIAGTCFGTSIQTGGGFTVTNTSVGNYTITFLSSFTTAPTVVVSNVGYSGNWGSIIINSISKTSFTITTIVINSYTQSNSIGFSFVAIES